MLSSSSATLRTGKRAREGPAWTMLSTEELSSLWTIYRTDVTLNAGRNIIMARLLSGGIVYTDTVSGVVPDSAFNSHVQRAFVPFARDVLDCLIVQGFCAFFVDAALGAPCCVPPGTACFGVSVDERTFRRSMGLFRTGADGADSRALFVVHSWPTSDGRPVSMVSAYRRSHAFLGMVELNTAIADFSSARPLVYTSMDSEKAFDRRHVYRNASEAASIAAAATMHLRQGAAQGRTAIDDAHSETLGIMGSMNSAHADIMKEQQRLVQDINRGLLDARSVRLDPGTGLPVFDASVIDKMDSAYNVVPLPVDSKVFYFPLIIFFFLKKKMNACDRRLKPRSPRTAARTS